MTTLRPRSKTTKLPSEVLRTNTRRDDVLNLNLVRSDPFREKPTGVVGSKWPLIKAVWTWTGPWPWSPEPVSHQLEHRGRYT